MCIYKFGLQIQTDILFEKASVLYILELSKQEQPLNEPKQKRDIKSAQTYLKKQCKKE